MAPHESSAPEAPTWGLAIQLLLSGLWLGASAFFTLAVAPAAFSELPSRDAAGALVGRMLPALFWSGAATGLILLGMQLQDAQPRFRRSRMGLALLVITGCAIAQFWIAPRIATLRDALTGPLSALAPGDPLRVAFGRLHMLSVAWLGVGMVASMTTAALLLIIIRSRERT